MTALYVLNWDPKQGPEDPGFRGATAKEIAEHLLANPEIAAEVRRLTAPPTPAESAVLAALDQPTTSRQLAGVVGRKQSGVWNTLRDLQARGLVEVIGNVPAAGSGGPSAALWARTGGAQ